MKNLKVLLSVFAICFLVNTQVHAEKFRTISDTTGKLRKSHQPAFTVVSLAADATTLAIADGLIFETAINTGATAITDFTGPIAGNMVTIVGISTTTTNATTIADSGNFSLSAAWTASANNTITLLVRADNDYVEVSRAAN
tara:strand:+ start:4864 stop:5286 length:423 start_codon:yes stop_codon:yes gene_type:complete